MTCCFSWRWLLVFGCLGVFLVKLLLVILLRIGTEFLGTAFLALGMGLVLIIWLVADFYLSFQLAVGFGQTRTEFLISSTISYFVYIMFNLFYCVFFLK